MAEQLLTNFCMLKLLIKEFNPEQRGVLTKKEVEQINTLLCIEKREILDLRNLRDFVVMFFARQVDNIKCNDTSSAEDEKVLLDKLSGIVSVIDSRIFYLGGDV